LQPVSEKIQDIFADEEYECSLARDPNEQEEEEYSEEDGDIRIILQIGLFNFASSNKIIL